MLSGVSIIRRVNPSRLDSNSERTGLGEPFLIKAFGTQSARVLLMVAD